MAIEGTVKFGHPVLFGLIAIFAIIEIGITGSIVHDSNSAGNPDGRLAGRSRFLLFDSIWTFVFALLYLGGFLAAGSHFLFNIASHGIFIAITWLFWLIGASIFTALLGGYDDCSTDFRFGVGIACSKYNAAEAFAWIEWVLFTIGFVVVALNQRKAYPITIIRQCVSTSISPHPPDQENPPIDSRNPALLGPDQATLDAAAADPTLNSNPNLALALDTSDVPGSGGGAGQIDESPISPVVAGKKLEGLLGQRSDKEDLVDKNILKDSKVAPSLQAAQAELKRSQLEDSLEKALAQRPNPDELVKEGILNPDEKPNA